MSADVGEAAEHKSVVAVAVKSVEGRGSRRAVRWAVENLTPKADGFVLVHVIPTITSVPTPSGQSIPIEKLEANVVDMYVHDVKAKYDEKFLPFKIFYRKRKMEVLVLEGENPALALVNYISSSGIASMVMGSHSSNRFTSFVTACSIRKRQTLAGVPSIVLNHAPQFCDIYVVAAHKLITNSLSPLPSGGSDSKRVTYHQRECDALTISIQSDSLRSRAPSTSDLSFPDSQAFTHEYSSICSSTCQQQISQNLEDGISDAQTVKGWPSRSSTYSEQSLIQAEVERLRVELHNTVAMYNRACEDLVHAQTKVHLLSSECVEEARKVNAAQKKEALLRKVAAEEKEKHLEAEKEVEMAHKLLAKEAHERQIAEMKALKESLEKQKIADELLSSSDIRYRRYTEDEMKVATHFFSEKKVIGEGAYGKVFKCNLDNTPVAIKVLSASASNKKAEFLKEVEVLSRMRHPNIVLLLGACPESGCLVYEYVEKGSLEDHIYLRCGNRPLPWAVRFRIVFEVAIGLAFLHNAKPDPIVHRDLKPGNILLDNNYVSKIGDVGLAKFVSDVVPESVTEFRESIIAGTLYYIDPEYQRTGTLRPKSDIYAFGVIILQLLTGRHPKGLILEFENAIGTTSFKDILDKSIADWPLAEAEELAKLALECCKLRCRDRPDLDAEILPNLEKLAEFANANSKVERKQLQAPSHFYCPILQEVMFDPHIAADGFTYERIAIEVWLDRHSVSPVTRFELPHKTLIKNHTLHSAIQQWRSHQDN